MEITTALLHLSSLKKYSGDLSDMVNVEIEAYKLLCNCVVTMDGCGLELDAMKKYIDGDEKILKLTVLKHHAQGTGIWLPHDVAKCHGLFRKALVNAALTLCKGEEFLLPATHDSLWNWFKSLKLDPSLCRSLYKYAVNLPIVIEHSFTMKVLQVGFRDSGVSPLIFRDFLQRCPQFQKTIRESDLKHMESCFPSILDIIRSKGEILPHELLNVLGIGWALQLEASTLCSDARKALLQHRVSFTVTSTTPLNQRGTVILTSTHQKEQRAQRIFQEKTEIERKEANNAAKILEKEQKFKTSKEQADYALSVFLHESYDLVKHIFSSKCKWLTPDKKLALQSLSPLLNVKHMKQDQVNSELLLELQKQKNDGKSCLKLNVLDNHRPQASHKRDSADTPPAADINPPQKRGKKGIKARSAPPAPLEEQSIIEVEQVITTRNGRSVRVNPKYSTK